MHYILHESSHLQVPPKTVFDFSVKHDTSPKTFTGYGFIPAIVSVEVLKGDGSSAGTIRNVTTSDRQHIEELVVEATRPDKFVYATKRYGFPFSLIVKSAQGTFEFFPDIQGTRVAWTYDYTLTSLLAYPFAFIVLGIFFKKAMQISMMNTKKIVGEIA